MTDKIRKFAGMEIPPELTGLNFFCMYFCTLICGLMVTITALIYPAFLVDVIRIDQDHAGTINGLLHSLNQWIVFFFVAYLGLLSDRTGRRIIVLFGFFIMGTSFYLLTRSNDIAAFLHIPADLSSEICALLSWAPLKAADFAAFSPGLLITYFACICLALGIVTTMPQFVIMTADYTYEKDRGKGMAMNGVMMGISATLAFVVFAPIMPTIGVISVMHIVSAICFCGFVFACFFLKDRLPDRKPKDKGLLDIIPVVRKSLPIKATYLCALVIRADIAILAPFLIAWCVKYGTNSLGMTSGEATLKASIPMITLSITVLFVFPVIGILLDKVGRIPVIIVALFSGVIGMFLLAFVTDPFSVTSSVAAAFVGIGMAGAIAGPNALAADMAPRGRVGAVLGGLNTLAPAGSLFFLGVGGLLFDNFGPVWAFGIKGAATLALLIWMLARKTAIIADIKEISAQMAKESA